MTAALEHLATRVATDAAFLASALANYQRQHHLSDAELAGRLGCDRDTLTRLRLCGLPRVNHFADDCREIAERFGVKVEVIEVACWPW